MRSLDQIYWDSCCDLTCGCKHLGESLKRHPQLRKMRDGMITPQDPWSIQLEVVEGCNYSCNFCGIHSVRDPKDWHKYRMMDPELVTAMFTELNTWRPNIRVEINNHGEPTLHPEITGIIHRIRQACPGAHIQMQTNGSGIEVWSEFDLKSQEWFRAGLNMLCINCYDRWWDKSKAKSSTAWQNFRNRYEMFLFYSCFWAQGTDVQVIDQYYNNPDHVSMYHNHGPKSKIIMILDDLGRVNLEGAKKSSAKKIMNEAGNTLDKIMTNVYHQPKPTEPLKKHCVKVHREITIAWDGHVPLCCYDWKSTVVFGTYPKQSLREIWTSRQMNAVRQLLFNKNRNMAPCHECDYDGGPRPGFLKSPEIDATDDQLHTELAKYMASNLDHVYPHAEVFFGPIQVKAASNFVPVESLIYAHPSTHAS